MNRSLLSFFFLLALACSPKKNETMNPKETEAKPVDSTLETPTTDSEIIDEEMQTAFMVILDSSNDFNSMHALAEKTAQEFHLVFDTIEKQYFPEKNLWGVSLLSEDELYRGEYFPRRSDGDTHPLSLEYQQWYDDRSREKNLVLMAGIFSFSLEAEEYINKFREKFPHAYILQKEIYMGCMH
jgi:hypothetical protein